MICTMCGRDRKTICFKHIREHRGQADAHKLAARLLERRWSPILRTNADNPTSAR